MKRAEQIAVQQSDNTPREEAPEPGYNIQAVERLTGVPSETLRAWERRYGVPLPRRASNGQRVYTDSDVEIVRWLRQQTEHGVTVKRAVEQFQQNPSTVRQSLVPSLEPAALVKSLVEASLRFDVPAIERTLSQALIAHPLEVVCQEVVRPALADVGERWHRGEISPAVEHFATGMIRRRLDQLAAILELENARPVVVVGSAPGELHDVGALMFSMLLRRRGIRTIFLGQAVPLPAVKEIAERLHPDLICLSASTVEAVQSLQQVGEALKAMNSHAPPFAFGGQAFAYEPDLAKRIPGVYLGTDAARAAEQVEALLRTEAAA